MARDAIGASGCDSFLVSNFASRFPLWCTETHQVPIECIYAAFRNFQISGSCCQIDRKVDRCIINVTLF